MIVCLVTDRQALSPEARTPREQVRRLAHWLEEAVDAGVDLIQVRERDLPGRLLAELVRTVSAQAKGTTTRVVVNDRADVAATSGAHGVHLRGDGPSVARVKARAALAPDGWLVGRSIHSLDEGVAQADADYLLFGAVFASGPKPARGLEALRAIAASAVPPVLAIGGLTFARARDCMAAGAAGVAGIGLFLPQGRVSGALGITEAVQQLRETIDPAATGHLQ